MICTIDETGDNPEITKDLLVDIDDILNILGIDKRNVELTVYIVDKKIQKLNKKYRGINEETDVLSFPVEDKKTIGESIKHNKYFVLGDIFICLDFINEITKKESYYQMIYKIKLDIHNITFILIHSILHLLGYEHKKPTDKKKMFAYQKKIISQYLNAECQYTDYD